jgi:hypothetical protein
MQKQPIYKEAAAYSVSHSCNHLPQKEHASQGNKGSGQAQGLLSPRPAMDSSDSNANRVQASGSNYKAHATEQSALHGWKFGSMGVSVKDGEEAHECCGDAELRAETKTSRLCRASWRRAQSRIQYPESARS